jgi:hypothetical protein
MSFQIVSTSGGAVSGNLASRHVKISTKYAWPVSSFA